MKLIIILGALTSIILGSLNFLTYLQYLRYVRNDGQFNQLSPTLTFYKEYTFESSGFSFEIDDLNFIIKKNGMESSIILDPIAYSANDFSLFGSIINKKFIPGTNCPLFTIKYNINLEKIDSFRCTI